MAAKKVSTLIILGGNPAYDSPGDVDFAGAMKSVATTIHVGLYRDKTAKLATWHLPMTHFLESWGDARTWDGLVTLQQPLMAPLYEGSVSALDVAMKLTGKEGTSDQAVRETAEAMKPKKEAIPVGGSSPVEPVSLPPPAPADGTEAAAEPQAAPGPVFAPTDDEELKQARKTLTTFLGDNMDWRRMVAQGFIDGTGSEAVSVSVQGFASPKVDPRAYKPGAELGNGELEVFFYDDGKVHDGRFANNGWLQELPDFTTKLTWDNAAILSPGYGQEARGHRPRPRQCHRRRQHG